MARICHGSARPETNGKVETTKIEPALAGLLADLPETRTPIVDTSFEALVNFHLNQLATNSDDQRVTEADRALARVAYSEPLIPFEESPLQALSLKDIVHATGVAVGAYVGFVVAGSNPLLFITVPAGMVICGAASGLGRGIEDGLRQRIKYLLRRTPPRKRTPKRKE